MQRRGHLLMRQLVEERQRHGLTLVPPRYSTSYFHHIFGGGYSAQTYVQPDTAGVAVVHFTFFKASGDEQPIASATATQTGPSGATSNVTRDGRATKPVPTATGAASTPTTLATTMVRLRLPIRVR